MSFLEGLISSQLVGLVDNLDIFMLEKQPKDIEAYEIASDLLESFYLADLSYEESTKILQESKKTAETIQDYELYKQLSRQDFSTWVKSVANLVIYRELEDALAVWFSENGVGDRFIYTDDEAWQEL